MEKTINNAARDAEIMRLHLAGNDAPNNIAAELGISIDEVNAVIERERKVRTTATRDAEILASYKSVGDAHVLAKRHGVDVAHVWRLVHRAEVGKHVSRATEYAQAVMRTGEVVCALPANILKTTTGSDAFIQQLEAAIKAQDRDLNVVVAIAVIPVEEIEGMVAADPIDNPRGVAASLQAKAVNAHRTHVAREFDLQLLRLKHQLSVTEDQQVATLLGMSKFAFSDRKKRGSFPIEKLHSLKVRRPDLEFDIDFIVTGKKAEVPA